MLHENFFSRGDEVVPRAPLRGEKRSNVAIVGGGIAGLAVAEELIRRGFSGVTLAESRFCGAGASGRSSGFITPASELGLSDLQRRFGDQAARQLWDAARAGCSFIRESIERYAIDCNCLDATSLFVASDQSSFQTVAAEHQAFHDLGYESTLYHAPALPALVGTETYGGGMRFGDCFSINAYQYVRGLAAGLEQRGLMIYESSPVIEASANVLRTAEGSVRADRIFFCLDHAAGRLGVARSSVYHAQTFLTVTEPLEDSTVKSLFPNGPQLVWDTDLIYQYFRLTPDQRLLVGGGLLSKTYAPETDDPAPAEYLVRQIRRRFPQLNEVRFHAWWEGLIGVTKDLLPLGGRYRSASQYAALCSAGLPWSVVSANLAVKTAIGGNSPLTRFLRTDRSFTELDLVQPILRKPLTFALSHGYTKWLLRGDARAVARRKLVLAAAALGTTALAAGHHARRRS